MSNLTHAHISPMLRLVDHQVPYLVQEELHEGLENGLDILSLNIERQRDV